MASRYSLVLLCLVFGLKCCYGLGGSGSFGFDIHHRFSEGVKGLLPFSDLPRIGSQGYYALMAHRDRMLHGRRLSSTTDLTKLTFEYGNETFYIPRLGFLHYANVSLGTPSKSYLVALDTGSDLFWLPCDCTECVRSLNTTRGEVKFNIYSPNTSTTSEMVPCSSPLCSQKRQCSAATDTCPFNIMYLSANTSSNGILVEDILHLVTDDYQTKAVSPRITFGCGQVLTGSFLKGGAPNGLFGLGIEDESVPSILAKQGLISNSFSMCFGPHGIGRISFGDLGSSDQGETPFTLNNPHPTYNITVTNIKVGSKSSALPFTAIFDSGTSFTYLSDPTYTYIAKTFDSQANDIRHESTTDFPFEYCYDLSANQTSYLIPVMRLTMEEGDVLDITNPTIGFGAEDGSYVYCLAILKSDNVNLIGQNFMTGYRVVFNRETMRLGWKKSDCYDESSSISPGISPAVPPAVAANPPITTNSSKTAAPSPTGNNSPQLNKFTYSILIMIIFSFIAIF
uniref:Peptidase A1 domain-containing protein n=1 Tax=Kalanchoe fedtschenkoi TaxID=63787 RepID=A0A7N0TUX6_KALFE